MKFASSVFASLVVGGARAFAPRPALRTFSTTRTALNANVLKLSDPQKELLDKVDVFIFDCDGVIWRVSHRYSSCLFFLVLVFVYYLYIFYIRYYYFYWFYYGD